MGVYDSLPRRKQEPSSSRYDALPRRPETSKSVYDSLPRRGGAEETDYRPGTMNPLEPLRYGMAKAGEYLRPRMEEHFYRPVVEGMGRMSEEVNVPAVLSGAMGTGGAGSPLYEDMSPESRRARRRGGELLAKASLRGVLPARLHTKSIEAPEDADESESAAGRMIEFTMAGLPIELSYAALAPIKSLQAYHLIKDVLAGAIYTAYASKNLSDVPMGAIMFGAIGGGSRMALKYGGKAIEKSAEALGERMFGDVLPGKGLPMPKTVAPFTGDIFARPAGEVPKRPGIEAEANLEIERVRRGRDAEIARAGEEKWYREEAKRQAIERSAKEPPLNTQTWEIERQYGVEGQPPLAEPSPETVVSLADELENYMVQGGVERRVAEDVISKMEPAEIAKAHEVAKDVENKTVRMLDEAEKAPEVGETPDLSPTPSETHVTYQARPLNLVDVKVSDIGVNKDLFQYKLGVNEKGIQGELAGRYNPHAAGFPIIYEDEAGRLWMVNGHHRLDRMVKDGVEVVKADVLRAADGVTVDEARAIGAETNILEGKGTIYDSANYFRRTGMSEEEARAKGIYGNGYIIGRYATDPVYDALYARKLPPDIAAAISKAAPAGTPGAERTQAIGLAEYFADKRITADEMEGFLGVASVIKAERSKQLGLWGELEDEALNEARDIGRRVAAVKKGIREEIAVLKAVTKTQRRMDIAKKYNIDINDPMAVTREVERLEAELARWEKWMTDPEKMAGLRQVLSDRGVLEAPAGAVPSEPATAAPDFALGQQELPPTAAREADMFGSEPAASVNPIDLERARLAQTQGLPLERPSVGMHETELGAGMQGDMLGMEAPRAAEAKRYQERVAALIAEGKTRPQAEHEALLWMKDESKRLGIVPDSMTTPGGTGGDPHAYKKFVSGNMTTAREVAKTVASVLRGGKGKRTWRMFWESFQKTVNYEASLDYGARELMVNETPYFKDRQAVNDYIAAVTGGADRYRQVCQEGFIAVAEIYDDILAHSVNNVNRYGAVLPDWDYSKTLTFAETYYINRSIVEQMERWPKNSREGQFDLGDDFGTAEFQHRYVEAQEFLTVADDLIEKGLVPEAVDNIVEALRYKFRTYGELAEEWGMMDPGTVATHDYYFPRQNPFTRFDIIGHLRQPNEGTLLGAHRDMRDLLNKYVLGIHATKAKFEFQLKAYKAANDWRMKGNKDWVTVWITPKDNFNTSGLMLEETRSFFLTQRDAALLSNSSIVWSKDQQKNAEIIAENALRINEWAKEMVGNYTVERGQEFVVPRVTEDFIKREMAMPWGGFAVKEVQRVIGWTKRNLTYNIHPAMAKYLLTNMEGDILMMIGLGEHRDRVFANLPTAWKIVRKQLREQGVGDKTMAMWESFMPTPRTTTEALKELRKSIKGMNDVAEAVRLIKSRGGRIQKKWLNTLNTSGDIPSIVAEIDTILKSIQEGYRREMGGPVAELARKNMERMGLTESIFWIESRYSSITDVSDIASGRRPSWRKARGEKISDYRGWLEADTEARAMAIGLKNVTGVKGGIRRVGKKIVDANQWWVNIGTARENVLRIATWLAVTEPRMVNGVRVAGMTEDQAKRFIDQVLIDFSRKTPFTKFASRTFSPFVGYGWGSVRNTMRAVSGNRGAKVAVGGFMAGAGLDIVSRIYQESVDSELYDSIYKDDKYWLTDKASMCVGRTDDGGYVIVVLMNPLSEPFEWVGMNEIAHEVSLRMRGKHTKKYLGDDHNTDDSLAWEAAKIIRKHAKRKLENMFGGLVRIPSSLWSGKEGGIDPFFGSEIRADDEPWIPWVEGQHPRDDRTLNPFGGKEFLEAYRAVLDDPYSLRAGGIFKYLLFAGSQFGRWAGMANTMGYTEDSMRMARGTMPGVYVYYPRSGRELPGRWATDPMKKGGKRIAPKYEDPGVGSFGEFMMIWKSFCKDYTKKRR